MLTKIKNKEQVYVYDSLILDIFLELDCSNCYQNIYPASIHLLGTAELFLIRNNEAFATNFVMKFRGNFWLQYMY